MPQQTNTLYNYDSDPNMEAYSATSILFENDSTCNMATLNAIFSRQENNYKNHLTYLITANEESSETYKQVYKENELLGYLKNIHHTITAVSQVNFSKFWRSIAYNIFAVGWSYGSIKSIIDLISENKIEKLCEIIASPLFNSVLITHKDDIKSIISTNAQLLANLVVSKNNDSDKNNEKIGYIVSKFNDFITKNKLAIINKIFQSSIINDISHLFRQANKKEHMKKGISEALSGLTISTPDSFNEEFMDFMHDEGNLDLLTKIITHPEIFKLIQKFILSLDLDELAIIDPHEELSSSSIDNIQEINDSENNLESADVMVGISGSIFMPNKSDEKILKYDLIYEIFSLFDNFEKWEEPGEKFAPFYNTLTSLKFLYYTIFITEPVENYLNIINRRLEQTRESKINSDDLVGIIDNIPNKTDKLEELKQICEIYNNIPNHIRELIDNDRNNNKPKAIVALIRNLRGFLKKSHNNVSHPHLRIIAKLLTDELLVAKDIPNPSNDISENINILTDTSNTEVIDILTEITSTTSASTAPLASLQISYNSVYNLIYWVLLEYSDAEYREDVTKILLKFIPALINKDMNIVIEESLNAISINDKFRDKIHNDKNLQNTLTDILIADLKHGYNPEQELEETFKLNSEQMAFIKETSSILEDDNLPFINRCNTIQELIIFTSNDDDHDYEKSVRQNRKIIENYISNSISYEERIFGIRTSVLRDLFLVIMSNFADKISKDDQNIKSQVCSLITWFTSRSKDFNEFFEIILSMLESSNDLQEMMRKSEAQDCIISLLEDLLTVTLEDGKYISNTKILWEDIANILKFIFNTLDYQNISEIRNDIKNILCYLTMEGKEEEDNNGFLEDIFSLINKMSLLKIILTSNNDKNSIELRASVTNTIINALDVSLSNNQMNINPARAALTNLIDKCLKYIPRYLDTNVARVALNIDGNDDNTLINTNINDIALNILAYLGKSEKSTEDTNNFFKDILDIVITIPEFRVDVRNNDVFRNDIVTIILASIKSSLSETGLGNTENMTDLGKIINSCLRYLPDAVTNSNEIYEHTLNILEFFVKEEKTPTDTHRFYDSILTLIQSNTELATKISHETYPETRNSISKFVVAIIKKNLNINNKNTVCNALDEIIKVFLQKLPEALINNENNVELKEKSLQTLDFFSDYPQEETNKPVTVTRFLLNVIEITEATEMSQELKRRDKKFLKAVKTIADAFTPSHWFIKNFIIDIDEDRLKLLLSNDKYRTKLIMLLNDLERNSWTKFFTIPCNTINLLWSLFWQRKINRALVRGVLITGLTFVMVSLIPGVNIALASNILISAFVGVLSVLHDYKKESKDFIGKNKSIISVTCAIVGGMALGIGAYYFSSLISVATPILLVGVVVVVLGLFTNKTETPKNKVFDKKNSEENALRFNTKLTTGQRVNNNRYESVNLTIKPRH